MDMHKNTSSAAWCSNTSSLPWGNTDSVATEPHLLVRRQATRFATWFSHCLPAPLTHLRI
ncbi:hypothetical protein E2C01_047152 [Portunus trituberculatus]|uniref:Uncharacterized protein n=1 Tax=Portunus trituberculatus TaxID=210409 RepID=A0A5B7G9P3_PORTR|nr:hypothetical protein [Portunus trituberculatus]